MTEKQDFFLTREKEKEKENRSCTQKTVYDNISSYDVPIQQNQTCYVHDIFKNITFFQMAYRERNNMNYNLLS